MDTRSTKDLTSISLSSLALSKPIYFQRISVLPKNLKDNLTTPFGINPFPNNSNLIPVLKIKTLRKETVITCRLYHLKEKRFSTTEFFYKLNTPKDSEEVNYDSDSTVYKV
jgi:hypothetical protein